MQESGIRGRKPLHIPDVGTSQLRSKSAISILDVGTGSGAIIVSLGTVLRHTPIKLYGSDISRKALVIARRNARTHRVKVRFVCSNLFQNVKGPFDIVIANLPYVPRKIYEKRFRKLKFEPKLALVDARKDFDVYKRFLQEAAAHVNLSAVVYLEIDPLAKAFIGKWAKKYFPQARLQFYKDFRGLWRYAVITLA